MTGDLFKNTRIVSKERKNELQKQDYTELKDKQGSKNIIFTRCKENKDNFSTMRKKEEQHCKG